MKDVTICMAYYINPGMLQIQYDNLARQPKEIRNHLRYVVVDDCSPTGPAYPPPIDIGVPVEIYRMEEDIPWNQDACRNLAVDRAKTKWVLLTDIDHLPSDKLLKRIVSDDDLNILSIYTFKRVNAPDLDPYKSHPNSWLMTKALYDKIGGYDERYRGYYGTDGAFRNRANRYARRTLECKEYLIRYPREVVPDASTTTLQRKGEENEAMGKIIRARIDGSGSLAPQRGLMKYSRVY